MSQKGRKDVTLYDEITTHKDATTGEVISSARRQVVKREKTPEFIMVFCQGLSMLTKSSLTNGQSRVLFEILKYTVNNSNMLMINPDVKNTIAADAELSRRTVDEAIKALTKKEIIIRTNRTYFLNPLLFGKGGWDSIKRLSQKLEIDYDFENLTATERISTKALYDEAKNVNNDSHKVVETKEFTDEEGTNNQKITIEEKQSGAEALEQQKKIDTSTNVSLGPETTFTKDTKNENIELELLKEKNKKLELENEAMRLKLEMAKLGVT